MAGHPPAPSPRAWAIATHLRQAKDFESAAVASLGHMLEVAQGALTDSKYKGGRLVRALLHLRPEHGYEGLYVLEAGASSLSNPSTEQELLPSATVWRWIEAGREPVAVDVEMGLITPRASEPQLVSFGGPADAEAMSEHSRFRLLRRGATHIYVLPLHVPGGLAGMISIEAECAAAMGNSFIWSQCSAELDTTAWLAGPYLTGLPRNSACESVVQDELLPVVGRTMAPIVNVLRAFASEEETLLIRGETGTGKSRLARWVHVNSPRSDGPFELLDLHTVPEETQMGELFGWKKGAFTGAVGDHIGHVGRSEGGTLFIDEIDKLSLRAQAALLTLLEERRYRVLGATGESRTANVRFVVGTNADLKALVKTGAFREDLYYRINVLPMALPPLRDRMDEVGPWAEFMLARRHEEKGGQGAVHLEPEAQSLLRRRTWPGNLRELDNMMRRAYTLATLDRSGESVTVGLKHLEMAENLEVGSSPVAPRSALQDLHEAISQLVRGLMSADPVPDLSAVDFPGALHGIVLAEAVRQTGDRETAFRLLGRGELVKNRNHHKALRRDWARALTLYEALAEPVPDELRDSADA